MLELLQNFWWFQIWSTIVIDVAEIKTMTVPHETSFLVVNEHFHDHKTSIRKSSAMHMSDRIDFRWPWQWSPISVHFYIWDNIYIYIIYLYMYIYIYIYMYIHKITGIPKKDHLPNSGCFHFWVQFHPKAWQTYPGRLYGSIFMPGRYPIFQATGGETGWITVKI